MRIAFSFLLCALLLGGVAFAQGAGGGTKKKTIAQQITDSATAGPGYMQQDFLTGLKGSMKEQFGEKRSDEMWKDFQGQELSEKDILGLMNGDATKSKLKDLFGAKSAELEKLLKALEEAVDDKNQSMFFGVVIFIMIVDFDVDPSSDFFKQVCNSKDEMSKEDFEKLMAGNVSTKTAESAFGMQSKDDQKFMQQILNGANQCPCMNHPMGESMGIGDPGKMDKEQFPMMAEGGPGSGPQFQDGMSGGFPFDQEMPAFPFMGDNMEGIFIMIGIIIVPGGEGDPGGMPAVPGKKGETPKVGKDATPEEPKTDEKAE
jgi:hypothetical protein